VTTENTDQTVTDRLNIADMEREVIRKALTKFGNNLTRAAEELGIGRTTLYRKIEEYGLSEYGK
jgi:transcriptional regulator with PAS, ATPase and Fis domain